MPTPFLRGVSGSASRPGLRPARRRAPELTSRAEGVALVHVLNDGSATNALQKHGETHQADNSDDHHGAICLFRVVPQCHRRQFHGSNALAVLHLTGTAASIAGQVCSAPGLPACNPQN